MEYRTIVAAVDTSDRAQAAVAHAAAIAATLGAELVVVSVYVPPAEGDLRRIEREAPPEVARAMWRLLGTDANEAALERAAASAGEAGAAVRTRLERGDAAEEILRVLREEQADLAVLGNKGMSDVPRFRLGSIPYRVSHHAPCDVLIVRTG